VIDADVEVDGATEVEVEVEVGDRDGDWFAIGVASPRVGDRRVDRVGRVPIPSVERYGPPRPPRIVRATGTDRATTT
jgi:hypothetical protein